MTLPSTPGESAYVFPVTFLGIQVDNMNGNPDESNSLAIPAKNFVEYRVLSRTVEVRLEYIDNSQRFYGSIFHPKGLMSKFLLAEGLAKLISGNGPMSIDHFEDAAELKEVQRQAKRDRKGRWASGRDEETFHGRIVEVVSGDCVVVLATSDEDGNDAPQERRVYLACVRAPKLGRRETPEEPGAFEAREFLRSNFIGKDANVRVAYTRDQ